MDTKALFHPLAWGANEAHQFLKEIPLMEEAGVIVKAPNWWNVKRPPRPQITIEVGNASASMVGLKALLDFNIGYTLPDGETLTLKELEDLLTAQGQLIQVKVKWVEVDKDKLKQVLSHWKGIERQVKREGLSFVEGLRLLAGVPQHQTEELPLEDITEWSKVIEGPWLNEILTRLRHPEQAGNKNIQTILETFLHTDLRPYQQSGVQWLWLLYSLRLGGCLADDMGLGKTIQVLALLLLAKYYDSADKKYPSLLIIPASLLENWQAEIKKFVPSLNIKIAHSSALAVRNKDVPDLSAIDLVITTYGYVQRLSWLHDISWNIVVLDEAQSIKNPSSKQTQAIKKLPSQVCFILTGTPIENRFLDFWSLFNFVAPGLLGSSRMFSEYGKRQPKTLKKVEVQEKENFMQPYVN